MNRIDPSGARIEDASVVESEVHRVDESCMKAIHCPIPGIIFSAFASDASAADHWKGIMPGRAALNRTGMGSTTPGDRRFGGQHRRWATGASGLILVPQAMAVAADRDRNGTLDKAE